MEVAAEAEVFEGIVRRCNVWRQCLPGVGHSYCMLGPHAGEVRGAERAAGLGPD